MNKHTMKGSKTSSRKSLTKKTIINMIRSQQEKKVSFAGVANAAVPVAGTVLGLSVGIAQGDDYSMRSGDVIHPISVKLLIRSEALVNSSTIRYIYFVDRQNTGTTPAVADVLGTVDFRGNYNPLLVHQQKRFEIKWDSYHDVCLAGQNVRTQTRRFTGFPPCYYNGTAVVATANGRNAHFLLIIGSVNTSEYDYFWEMEYTDS